MKEDSDDDYQRGYADGLLSGKFQHIDTMSLIYNAKEIAITTMKELILNQADLFTEDLIPLAKNVYNFLLDKKE